MRSQDDRQAARDLLRAAAIVPFTVIAQEVIPGSDEADGDLFARRILAQQSGRDKVRRGCGRGPCLNESTS